MNKLMIQDNFTAILKKGSNYQEIMDELIKFSEVKQSSDELSIVAFTSIAIWNAIEVGLTKEHILGTLSKYSYNVPSKLENQISLWFERYGAMALKVFDEKRIILTTSSEDLKKEVRRIKKIKQYLELESKEGFIFSNSSRGEIKSILVQKDILVKDTIGYTKGISLPFQMKIEVRGYQEDSAQMVIRSGAGIVCLPCGAGKTVVGLRAMSLNQTSTLIVTNSQASVKQWKLSLLKFTSLTEDQISTYDKDNKEIRPVTITTYNMLAYKNKGELVHFNKFLSENWGLLICDEVHLFPADMFRVVASLQSIKRLGLTASFIREDGREKEILSLLGPIRFNKPWKDLEDSGHIAKVTLNEVKVEMGAEDRKRYVEASNVQEKFQIASTSSSKLSALKQLLLKHKDDKVLVIGNFTEQLLSMSKELNIPCVYGESSNQEREKYYDMMRNDQINVLIASKIATTALDIPKINVVIQVSIQYGSRSAEAQVVGRSTRPKEEGSFCYTLVSKNTVEEDYNYNRQVFLTEEGYKYEIVNLAA